jgi:cytochrome b pre-mRNA-processing protein 3
MLHMWTLVARLRAERDRDLARQVVHQLTDHHFFDCERVMDVNHGLSSAAMRQRYLKDLFVQWRGANLSYDEGLARGDAALAAAVWRNLFRSSDAADPVRLAAVVAWIRGTLADLAAVDDVAGLFVPGPDAGLFRRRIESDVATVAALVERTP